MYQKIRFIYSLLEKRTKAKIFIFALSKISLSFLDLAGVLLIGLLLAKSVGGIGLQTTNSSNISSSIFQFLNDFSLIGLAFLASFAFLARSILSALFTKYMFEILSTTEAKLATQTFRYLLENMAWTVKKYSKSDLNYMLSASIMASIQIITSGISIVSDFFFLVVILATFLFINLETTLFIIFYFGVISVILHSFLGKRFEGAGKTSLNSGIAVTTIIYDVVQSFREVTSLRRENFFLEKFNNKKLDGSRSAFYVQYLNSLPRYIVESALVIGVLGIIFISYEPGNPERSAQMIGIFLTGALRILSSLLPLQTSMANYRHLLALSEKYLEFENLTQSNKKITPSTLTSEEGSREKFAQPIGIKVEDLSFAYIDSTSPALKGLNFSIKPGDLVAFIGPSGSGKSTLADILIGINKPSMGKIDYFSEETKNLQIDNFRVGYVPQTPGKIYGNIKENIAFGLDSQDVDSRLLARAIDISNLNELIRNLELGYETHLGEQTDSLSGGQMQRIGLARALYIDPNLLVLDEATSALDIESEYAITESLNEIRGKCTIIVIAHRLSTVQNADVVFVMNEGQIVASGKFSELATKNEMVAKYIELSDLNGI